MMKWYENLRHNWSYCHDLRFWISFYFLCGWEAVEYGEIPPFCVYAICHTWSIDLTICCDKSLVTLYRSTNISIYLSLTNNYTIKFTPEVFLQNCKLIMCTTTN